MGFLAIVICFILCFLSVTCNRVRNLRDNSLHFQKVHGYEFKVQRFYSNVVIHAESNTQCEDRSFSTAMGKYMVHVKCRPRDAVIQLHPLQDNYDLIPNMAIVKRCHSSGCYGRNSCIPTGTREVKVPVRIVDFASENNESQQCGYVSVTEHTGCKCGCLITANDCNHMQTYVPNECRCRCTNENLKTSCINEGKKWDDRTCSCICPHQLLECSTGMEWVPRKCKCMKVFDAELDLS